MHGFRSRQQTSIDDLRVCLILILQSTDFLIKNKDKLNEETFNLLQLSKFQFLKDLFKESGDAKDRKTRWVGSLISN